jgi:hypothetical protein
MGKSAPTIRIVVFASSDMEVLRGPSIAEWRAVAGGAGINRRNLERYSLPSFFAAVFKD